MKIRSRSSKHLLKDYVITSSDRNRDVEVLAYLSECMGNDIRKIDFDDCWATLSTTLAILLKNKRIEELIVSGYTLRDDEVFVVLFIIVIMNDFCSHLS